MASEESDRQELEQYAGVLADQADSLIRLLDVDVSAAETYSTFSLSFRQAADAYERLALAERRADLIAWERTRVVGRSGPELMDRLWKVREELRGQDESAARQEP